MSRNAAPPPEVTLVYREVGKTHVFTAANLRGFHVGSSSLHFAFDHLAAALGEHVSRACNCEASYRLQVSYDEFERHLTGCELTGNFVVAKRALDEARV